MKKNLRPIAFILASTNHGSMLINRHDYRMIENSGYGVGYQLLNSSAYDTEEINLANQLLESRRQNFGDGVVAIDCGANIGVHTIEWAKLMYGWGQVISFEAQERIYYALAGNIAMNNCFNAKAVYAAVGAEEGDILVPLPDYLSPSSFGSLELRQTMDNEFIGQEIDYTEKNCVKTKMVTIDKLELDRLDFLKIDIEGMEIEALMGCQLSISKFKPQLIIERIKSNEHEIQRFLERFNYKLFSIGNNLIAVHHDDPVSTQISLCY